MLFVSQIAKSKIVKNSTKEKSILKNINLVRSKVPAITHVDNSARVQTVEKNTNNYFYELIEEFNKISKVPILVNTSFNIRGEPIVCSPQDAFKCLMGTDLDILVIENFFLEKKKQNKLLIKDYRDKFKLD